MWVLRMLPCSTIASQKSSEASSSFALRTRTVPEAVELRESDYDALRWLGTTGTKDQMSAVSSARTDRVSVAKFTRNTQMSFLPTDMLFAAL